MTSYAEWTIARWANGPMGTFGELTGPGLPDSLWTVERSWASNEPFNSAIPSGTYDLSFFYSNRFRRRCLKLEHVPGRTDILIHPANVARDLEGCIAPGLRLGTVGGLWGVVRSRDAFALLLRAVEAEVDAGRAPRVAVVSIDRSWAVAEQLGVRPIEAVAA